MSIRANALVTLFVVISSIFVIFFSTRNTAGSLIVSPIVLVPPRTSEPPMLKLSTITSPDSTKLAIQIETSEQPAPLSHPTTTHGPITQPLSTLMSVPTLRNPRPNIEIKLLMSVCRSSAQRNDTLLAMDPLDALAILAQRPALEKISIHCDSMLRDFLACFAAVETWRGIPGCSLSSPCFVSTLLIAYGTKIISWLPHRCATNKYFRELRKEICGDAISDSCDVAKKIVGNFLEFSKEFTPDEVATTQIEEFFLRAHPTRKYLPLNERTPTPMPPSRACPSFPNVVFHPITFAAPKELIVEKVDRRKYFDFSDAWPRYEHKDKGFQIQDEYFLRFDTRHALFSLTSRRYGWDCFRHYELLAAGCVPYFPDLILAPKYSIASLPRDILLKVLDLPGLQHNGRLRSEKDAPFENEVIRFKGLGQQPGGAHLSFKSAGTIRRSDGFNLTKYFEIADELLEYTKKYLSSQSLAAYMLARIGKASARNILIIHGHRRTEFMQSVILHGFLDLGLNVTSLPLYEPHHRQQHVPSMKDLERLRMDNLWAHGMGMFYGFRMPREQGLGEERISLSLARKEFDVVIYCGFSSWFTLGLLPLINEVRQIYSKEDVVFVNGDDAAFGDPSPVNMAAALHFGHVFIREMADTATCFSESAPRVNYFSFDPAAWARDRSPAVAKTNADLCPHTTLNCGKDVCRRDFETHVLLRTDHLPDHEWDGKEWKANHRAWNAKNVILLDGHHWGRGYVGPLLKSIRAAGVNALIVMLTPTDVIPKLNFGFPDLEEWHPFQLFEVVDKGNPATRVGMRFLLEGAEQWLRTTQAQLYRRVIISEWNAVWLRDLFESVTHQGVFLHRAEVGNRQASDIVGRCFPHGTSTRKSVEETFRERYLFYASLIGGSPKRLRRFLSEVNTFLLGKDCDVEGGVTYIAHQQMRDMFISIWSTETGPVLRPTNYVCTFGMNQTMEDPKSIRNGCGTAVSALIAPVQECPNLWKKVNGWFAV